MGHEPPRSGIRSVPLFFAPESISGVKNAWNSVGPEKPSRKMLGEEGGEQLCLLHSGHLFLCRSLATRAPWSHPAKETGLSVEYCGCWVGEPSPMGGRSTEGGHASTVPEWCQVL